MLLVETKMEFLNKKESTTSDRRVDSDVPLPADGPIAVRTILDGVGGCRRQSPRGDLGAAVRAVPIHPVLGIRRLLQNQLPLGQPVDEPSRKVQHAAGDACRWPRSSATPSLACSSPYVIGLTPHPFCVKCVVDFNRRQSVVYINVRSLLGTL